MSFPEYQTQRHRLVEEYRNCLICLNLMQGIKFESHPIGDQVWKDWECNFCGKKLFLRYFDDWLNKRIEVTERNIHE